MNLCNHCQQKSHLLYMNTSYTLIFILLYKARDMLKNSDPQGRI